MKTFNMFMIAGLSALTLSACGAKEAIESIRPPSGDTEPKSITTPDFSSTNIKNVTLTINGKTYQTGKSIDIASISPNSVHNQDYEINGQTQKGEYKEKGTLRIYKTVQRFPKGHAAILAKYAEQQTENGVNKAANKFEVLSIQGNPTKLENLPKQGSYSYQGLAFTGKNDTAQFIYNIDFDKRVGSGQIGKSKQYDIIKLKEHDITALNASSNFHATTGIKGDAEYGGKTVGKYEVGLFGPAAEEIAGKANLNIGGNEVDFGFGATKQPGSK